MTIQIEKSCFDRDKACAYPLDPPHLEPMTERWHPAVRLLIIVGSAASLWAGLFALVH